MVKKFCCLLILIPMVQACAPVDKPADTVYYVPRRRAVRKSPKRKTSSVPTQRSYTVFGKTYHPVASDEGFVQEGIASWYGKDFHGKLTSNGEVYDMYAETAAHKILPMNTYVEVTNLRNNKKTVVRINDRGPFVKGRILDLSYTGAKKLDVVAPGTAPVRIKALGQKVVTRDKQVKFVPVDVNSGSFSVQVGAFMDKDNADRLVAQLSERYVGTHWVVFDSPKGRFYRVRAGKVNKLAKAENMRRELAVTGFPGAFIVAK